MITVFSLCFLIIERHYNNRQNIHHKKTMITNNTFCYWDAKSDIDTFVLLLNLLITSVILALTIVYAIRFRKTNTLRLASSKQIYGKFVAVMLWALSYQVVILYSVGVYWLAIKNRSEDQPIPDMTLYSKIYALLQAIPAMIIQTLLFTTAKQMISNGMGLLLNRQLQPSRKQRVIYTRIEQYYWARLGFLFVTWILVIMPFENVYAYEIITRINIILLMVDSAIIVLILRYCHKYLKIRAQTILQDNAPQRKKLNTETILLASCGICRFLLDLIFYILVPIILENVSTSQEQEKPCIEEVGGHLYYTIGYLGLVSYSMHHVCIAVILKIYKPVEHGHEQEDRGSGRVVADGNGVQENFVSTVFTE